MIAGTIAGQYKVLFYNETGRRLTINRAGLRYIGHQCDGVAAGPVERAVQQTVEEFDRLDILFANAGINGVWAPIEELTPEECDRRVCEE